MNQRNPNLLFEYILEREAGVRGKTLFIQFRRILLRRALLLFLALPLDLIAMCVQMLRWPWQPRRKTITLTRMVPDLLAQFTKSGLVYAGPPSWAALAWRQPASYMPISVPYILLTVALYLPNGARRILGRWTLRWIDWLFKLYKADGAHVLVHSDALPFARAFVLQAQDRGMKTICVQHGIFHANSGIKNLDGYLCDLNVVRSREDGELIASSNRATELCVEPNFFLTVFHYSHSENLKPVITLVGEGFHIYDKDFSKSYIEKLRQFEMELFSLGCHVLFRPHPSERSFAKKFGFQQLDLTDLSISMAKTDVYLGFSSTLLIEAVAAGRVAAQIPVYGVFNPGMNRAEIHVWRAESAQDVFRLIAAARTQGPLVDDLVGRKNRAVVRVYQEIIKSKFKKI